MSDSWEYGEAAGETPGPGDGSTRLDARGETGVADRFPWPPPEDGGILAAFGETWKSAAFDPGRFFSRTPRDGGTGAAVLYYLVIGLLVAGATLFWSVLGQYGAAPAQETLASELGLGAIRPLTRFLLSPLLLLLTLGVSAGVVHVLLLLLGGARHGFGTTIRVFCYAYSPMLLAVVPILGSLVGMVWMVVLAVIGVREAHETDGWKAGLAVILPFILLLGVTLLMVLTVLAAGAAILG